MATLFTEINSIMDNFDRPTYNDPDERIQALQGLHMSDILGYDDDGADEAGPNDIEISRMDADGEKR